MRRKLTTLTKAAKDFDEAHSAVLESIRLGRGDADLKANVDTEINEVITTAEELAEETLDARRPVTNPGQDCAAANQRQIDTAILQRDAAFAIVDDLVANVESALGGTEEHGDASLRRLLEQLDN